MAREAAAFRRDSIEEGVMIEFQVSGMSCGGCVASVTRAVKSVDAGAEVNADLASQKVSVASGVPAEQLKAAIENAGYDVLATTQS
jgi:copper chaperone